jgi:hypothetical protein
MAISDCVALGALRDGADLKGIAFISSQVVLTCYHGAANYRRLGDNSNIWLNALVVAACDRTLPASQAGKEGAPAKGAARRVSACGSNL